MMQEWIVAVIVGVAAWVVVKRFTPLPWQRAIGAWVAGALRKGGARGLAEAMEARADQRSDSGTACGSCGNCGSSGAGPAARQSAITPEALKQTIPQRGKSLK